MNLYLQRMALFKFRKTPAEALAGSQPPPSVEQLRLRAKYRLVGASILVLLGVLVFPLMFDKQPRPLPTDTPMILLDPAKSAAPAPVLAPAPAPKAMATPKASVAGGLDKGESLVTDKPSGDAASPSKPATVKAVASAEALKVESKPVARVEPKPDAKPEQKASVPSTASASSSEAQRVQALLEGKAEGASQSAAADATRFVVQVGAFAESERAQEVRGKIERAGMKTYVQVAQTRDGPRIRVRIGPFDQKADAERASEQVKKLDLPAVILSL